MHAPGPALLNQLAHHRLQVVLHADGQVRARLVEVFEVSGGIDQHLARSVVAIIVVALAGMDLCAPGLEVRQLFLRFLGEEVVGQPDRELTVLVQLLDDLVVVGIVLEAAARVDDAGYAQPVQLAHEVAGRVQLILFRQLRGLGQGRV
ncbi:hypothetical protein D3C73_765470 [compost metagenome]